MNIEWAVGSWQFFRLLKRRRLAYRGCCCQSSVSLSGDFPIASVFKNLLPSKQQILKLSAAGNHSLTVCVSLSPLLLSQGNEGAGVREAMATELLSDRLSTEEWTAQKKRQRKAEEKGEAGLAVWAGVAYYFPTTTRTTTPASLLSWAKTRRTSSV